MANNLFVSYDLYSPDQNYQNVAAAIGSLGQCVKPQRSFWYVRSRYSAQQACKIVWRSMDVNDSLMVVDASNNEAFWVNIDPNVASFIQKNWQKLAA